MKRRIKFCRTILLVMGLSFIAAQTSTQAQEVTTASSESLTLNQAITLGGLCFSVPALPLEWLLLTCPMIELEHVDALPRAPLLQRNKVVGEDHAVSGIHRNNGRRK